MLRFDFTNLSSNVVGWQHGMTPEDWGELAALVPPAHQRFQEWRSTRDAIFYDIVFDGHLIEGIEAKANEVADRFEDLVVLGIGGSALGLRCAAQALLPPFWNLRNSGERGRRPRLFVCDNIDPETFSGLLDVIDLKRTCIAVISKSGKTTETAAQFFIVLERLKNELGNRWREHVVVITDPVAGELRALVAQEKLFSFPLEPKLGGRFSFLSAVGLFPAACLGVDIKGLVAGAQAMVRRSGAACLDENIPYRIGATHYWFDTKKRKPISVMMPYSDALVLAADWYAQLWAESLGKGGMGQTPVRAVGATDQHSQVQLYMEGPADKVFTFVGVESFRVSPKSTRIEEAAGSFGYLVGHDLGAILKAEQAATTAALAEMGRPNLTITFPMIDAHHLGEFFMAYEIATAFAGALYGINPFDQPGVELGKKLTREMLRAPTRRP